jgi:hypothetical protein
MEQNMQVLHYFNSTYKQCYFSSTYTCYSYGAAYECALLMEHLPPPFLFSASAVSRTLEDAQISKNNYYFAELALVKKIMNTYQLTKIYMYT